MSQRRALTAAVAVSTALLVTGCGTRLPNSAFTAAGQAASGTGSVAGTGGANGPAGGAAAAGPSASATTGPNGVAPGSTQTSGGRSSPHGNAAVAKKLGNYASDTGVTATTIKVGIIVSKSNPFDPRAFAPSYYGAEAYFRDLDAHGGVHGRVVIPVFCDDQGSGSQNVSCVHNLIDSQHIFAMAGNAIFSYDGASYVQSKGVPDIAGQPIDTAYDQYHHLWEIYGDNYPRNGTVGYGGRLYGGTEVYRFFKVHFPHVPLKAGVVYYNQSQSSRYGQYIAQGLRKEGYSVIERQVDFALPDYNSAVIAMKSYGVQYVYDALDSGGNQNLCQAMDSNGLSVTAKVTTTESWVDSVATDYGSAAHCRNEIWATGNTANYDDTNIPEVAAFRAAVHRYGYDGRTVLSDWELEGWASAQWLTDAISSCGARLTRGCVEGYMSRPGMYYGHGLFTGRNFQVQSSPPPQVTNCINVARWQDSAQGGHGGWVTQVPDMNKNCFNVPDIYYTA